jgi:hypothetical protein
MKKCNDSSCSEQVDDKFAFCKKHYYQNIKANSLPNSGGMPNKLPSSNSLSPPFDAVRIKDIHFQLCIKVAGGIVAGGKLKGDEAVLEVVRLAKVLCKECWPNEFN